MKIYYSAIITLFIFGSCKKELLPHPDNGKMFAVKGVLLESTSNPVPVSYQDIKLIRPSIYSYYWGYNYGFMSLTTNTDKNGNFQFKYPGKSSILDGNNQNLYFQLSAPTVFGSVVTKWSFIRPYIDTNVNTIYLYKKISQLIRGVKFDKNLLLGDSILINTSEAYQNLKAKVIFGPVSAGSTVVVDTLTNYLFTNYKISEERYECLATLYINNNKKYDTTILISNIDENINNIVLRYY
jgi:hypothetical protein